MRKMRKETKAHQAREGMERQAAQLKVDKEKKDEEMANQASLSNPRFAAGCIHECRWNWSTAVSRHISEPVVVVRDDTAPCSGSLVVSREKWIQTTNNSFQIATADAIIESKKRTRPRRRPWLR
jgi:hypothetical protein